MITYFLKEISGTTCAFADQQKETHKEVHMEKIISS
jgi:hypothetical protein